MSNKSEPSNSLDSKRVLDAVSKERSKCQRQMARRRRNGHGPDIVLERELSLVALDPIEPAQEEPQEDGEGPVWSVRGNHVLERELVVLVCSAIRVPPVEAREEGGEGRHGGGCGLLSSGRGWRGQAVELDGAGRSDGLGTGGRGGWGCRRQDGCWTRTTEEMG